MTTRAGKGQKKGATLKWQPHKLALKATKNARTHTAQDDPKKVIQDTIEWVESFPSVQKGTVNINNVVQTLITISQGILTGIDVNIFKDLGSLCNTKDQVNRGLILCQETVLWLA